MTEQPSGKLYMNRMDALEHTGVTAKQLRQWREAGLIKPELGSQPGRELKFTARDLRSLAVIKKLRDEGYPLRTIEKMFSVAVGPSDIDFDTWFWDHAAGEWVTRRQIAQRAIATEDTQHILPWLLGMALTVFLWRSAEELTSRDVRQTRAREIIDTILKADGADALSREPLARYYIQRLLEIRSENRIRGHRDRWDLLYNLERKSEKSKELWEIVKCARCGNFFVGNYGAEFCSEECRVELPFE